MNKDALIPFKNEVYKLIKHMPEHGLTNELDLPFWENKLNSDLVLKKDGFLFFCTIIKQADIISESVYDVKNYDSMNLKIEKNIKLFINL